MILAITRYGRNFSFLIIYPERVLAPKCAPPSAGGLLDLFFRGGGSPIFFFFWFCGNFWGGAQNQRQRNRPPKSCFSPTKTGDRAHGVVDKDQAPVERGGAPHLLILTEHGPPLPDGTKGHGQSQSEAGVSVLIFIKGKENAFW